MQQRGGNVKTVRTKDGKMWTGCSRKTKMLCRRESHILLWIEAFILVAFNLCSLLSHSFYYGRREREREMGRQDNPRAILFPLVLALLPMRGTASEVVGIMAETRFMNTVSESRTVTSARKHIAYSGETQNPTLLSVLLFVFLPWVKMFLSTCSSKYQIEVRGRRKAY